VDGERYRGTLREQAVGAAAAALRAVRPAGLTVVAGVSGLSRGTGPPLGS